jgi:ornithine cyclodeaminase
MRVLNADETRQCLPMLDAIDAMEDAFGPDRELPPRELIGSSFFMPGRVGLTSGVKVVSTVPGNPAGIVAVFDGEGSPIGIVDGPTLTAIRTAAGAGLATRLLAPNNASTLAMLGAGAMARDQIEAVRVVRPIERVLVWSRSARSAIRLAQDLGIEVATTADEAVSQADVISTATPSKSPLFDAAWLRPEVHINAVGAFTPEMVEIPPEAVRSAFRVVDDRTSAAAEAGDLLQAGVEPDAEIGELLDRDESHPSPITLFKSVGIASQDVAAAAAALSNAARKGLGTVVS